MTVSSRHRAPTSSPATAEQAAYAPRHAIHSQKGDTMSDQLTSTQVSGTEPAGLVTVFGAIAAGATALVTALALIPGVPSWVVAGVGAVAAVSTAVGGYLAKTSVTARTTPWTDVAAKVTPSGKVIAGPAATQPTGATVAVVTDSAQPSFQPGASVYPDKDGDPL